MLWLEQGLSPVESRTEGYTMGKEITEAEESAISKGSSSFPRTQSPATPPTKPTFTRWHTPDPAPSDLPCRCRLAVSCLEAPQH